MWFILQESDTLRTVSEGFLGVSRLAFIAANVMQTLRTIPCAHMQQSRDGGEKGPHFWEAGWLQPSKTPAVQDHQTCVAKGSFYSDFLGKYLEFQPAVFQRPQRLQFFSLFFVIAAVNAFLQRAKEVAFFSKNAKGPMLLNDGY